MEPERWVVDADAVARLVALEGELAALYDALRLSAPDLTTDAMLQRLATAARNRAELFEQALDVRAPAPDRLLLRQWVDAQSRFERAAKEAADTGDPELQRLQVQVRALGQAVDTLLLHAGDVL
ncbi:MAG: hypothetical protein LC624_04255 [Halobacteriales archaeon]|nr:hypothetical protein [Halobacteriales archaeon]